MVRRHRLVQRRKTVGLSQESLAEVMGVDRSTVVRWERADTDPQPWHRPRLAEALKVTIEELAQLLTDVSDSPAAPTPAVAPVPTPLPPPMIFTGGSDLAAMQSLRLVDRQVGGGYLYAAVASYLQHNLAPRLFGHAPSNEQQPVFVAAAGLTEMAGWMAHDAGRDSLAAQHFQRALGMAEASHDQQVQVHVLGSLSHLAHHAGQPGRAAAYARRGKQQLTKEAGLPSLKARLLAMEARSFAASQDPIRAAERLRLAEQTLAISSSAEPSPWISTFDEASLATEAARCFRELGQLGVAREQAERVMQLRTRERTRSRAFAQLMLASIAVSQQRLDEACLLGGEILDATSGLGSHLVAQQLQDLRRSLVPFGRSHVVSGLLARMDTELRNRHQPAQWLPPLAASPPNSETT